MVKFIIIIVFINFMVGRGNRFLFIYYNLLYLISLMIMRIYIFKRIIWTIIRLVYGLNYHSFWLILLRVWIIGLIFKRLDDNDWFKIIIFINILLILIRFFMGLDIIIFYLIFEVRLIPTFFLIVYWGVNFERVSAAYYLIIYILLISFPLLLYILKLFRFTLTFRFILILKYAENYRIGFWGFLMFYISFFIKFPIYFVHVWLPKAHVEAPVYGSIVLAGVLLKIGGYGLIRFREIFFKVVVQYGYLILRVRIIGSLITRIVTLIQLDIKSLVAYSSVVHINLILGGIIILNKLGLLGGYVIIISHGLCSSGIFYIVNIFYRRTGRRLLIINKGIVNKISVVCIWWFLFCVMNFSYPFSLNFISEIMILIVLLNWEIYLLLVLIITCFYRRIYSLYLFSFVYHGYRILSRTDFVLRRYIKEYIVIIIHFFPLLLLLLNLIMFI